MTKVPALTRTWKATVDFGCYGENWGSTEYTVTLTRQDDGTLTALVAGAATDLKRAVNILQSAAHTEVLHEVLEGETEALPETATPATIGKARACRLHKLLSVLGLYASAHYRFAEEALGYPCPSLAALTEAEARKVWSHVCAWKPNARSFKKVAA